MGAMNPPYAINIPMKGLCAAGSAEHEAVELNHFSYVRFRTKSYILGVNGVRSTASISRKGARYISMAALALCNGWELPMSSVANSGPGSTLDCSFCGKSQ